MIKMNSATVARILLATGVAAAHTLTSADAHAQWIMGAVQQASSYFTELETTMTVPELPASGNDTEQFSLWPGLEDAQGDLIQVPLGLNQGGVTGWSMHNEVALLPSGGFADGTTSVNVGDTIYTLIYLDGNGGSKCKLATGANCNYKSFWMDLNTGTYAYISNDLTMTSGPTTALGTVFEISFGSAKSCNDLPIGEVNFYSNLYQFASSSHIYSQVPATYTVDTPGTAPFENFSFSRGNNAYPNCANMFAAPQSGDQAEIGLFFNI